MKYDLVVIGGGPGGYVAAIRSAQLGQKTALIEKERLGGVCTNSGCIPTKYLLTQSKLYKSIKSGKHFTGNIDEIGYEWENVLEEKQIIIDRLVKGTGFLLEKNKVDILKGKANLLSPKSVQIEGESSNQNDILEAEHIILATGSLPSELPFLKRDGKIVIDSTDALNLTEIPKSLVVIGAGAVGLEIGTVFKRMGAEVTVIELMETILPGCDKEIGQRLERLLKRQGLKIHTQTRIEKASASKTGIKLDGINHKNDKSQSFEAQKVLLAVGRKPNTGELINSLPQLAADNRGFIQVDSYLETNIKGIYAIGDIIGGMLLAHKASHEGIIAAENIAGFKNEMKYNALPQVVFTDPEFASVGLTEEQAIEMKLEYIKGDFSLQANGRALTLGKSDGMVKVIAQKNGPVIGAHILAPNASELITEMTLAIKQKLTLEDCSSAIHIHPTLSEAVMEACLDGKEKAIHKISS